MLQALTRQKYLYPLASLGVLKLEEGLVVLTIVVPVRVPRRSTIE